MNTLAFRALAPSLALLSLASVPSMAQTGTPGASSSTTQNAPLPQKIILSGGTSAGKLVTNRTRYGVAQPIKLAFTVSNPTNQTVTYNFSTGQQYDLTASDADKNVVWQWSHGRFFTQSLTRLSLKPHKHVTYIVLWNGRGSNGRPLLPGPYTLNARQTSESRPAVTGGIVVDTDRDPNNMGVPTKTPADTGAVRQVDVTPPVTASTTIVIGASR